MLQAALGGYQNADGIEVFTDAPNVYREPGFDLLSSLTFAVPAEARKVYILIRIRSGDGFEAGTSDPSGRFTLSITNATTGADAPSTVSTNNVNTGWDPSSGFNPYVITVNNISSVNETDYHVKVIDSVIKDSQTSSMITYRITVAGSLDQFSFLHVVRREENVRPKSSALGTAAVLKLSKHGSYAILSPLASFKETSANSTFSYPMNAVRYQREKTTNDEVYEFSVSNFSHDVIEETVNLFPVPDFHKVAVLQIDGRLQRELFDLRTEGYIDVDALGKISGVKHTFRVHLAPTIGGIDVRSL